MEEMDATETKKIDVIGISHAMHVIFDLISRIRQSNANVLISGESGSGKEVIARAIRESGHRRARCFIAINCSAIPETLLEAELFGHAKDSFTGAARRFSSTSRILS